MRGVRTGDWEGLDVPDREEDEMSIKGIKTAEERDWEGLEMEDTEDSLGLEMPDPNEAMELATQESRDLLTVATALRVETPEQAQDAIAFRSQIAARRKAVEEWFAAPVAAAYRAHKELTQRRFDALAKFSEPSKVIDRKLAAYELERKRQEREAAERAAVEQQRLAADAEPGEIVVVPPAPTAPKPQGVAFVPVYSGKVVDLMALVKAVANNDAPLTFLQPDQVQINALARRLGEQFRLPGCELVVTTSVRGTK